MNVLIEQHRKELTELCRRFRVQRLDLFGSAAIGTFKPDSSDLDFIVRFDLPGEYGYAMRYLNFAESLESLFNRPVDLLTEPMIGDPDFRDEVEQHRQNLFMEKEANRRLRHALEACNVIGEFIKERTFEDYRTNVMLRSAVERQFEIVGEALHQAELADKSVADVTPNLRSIVGLRNRIIHGYDKVDDLVLWAAIQDHLPELKTQLEAALEQ
jgi:uncharacterized protein with HEPN domain/predicted nucleotidyltransferase